jgi:hypothetical protein
MKRTTVKWLTQVALVIITFLPASVTAESPRTSFGSAGDNKMGDPIA